MADSKADVPVPGFTPRERRLIIEALRIAAEDGSIYGPAETDKEIKAVNLEIEIIERKVKAL